MNESSNQECIEYIITAVSTRICTQIKEDVARIVMECINGPPSDVIDIGEAALFLKKKKKTIYTYVAQGRIPYIKQGRSVRFLKSELLDWVKSFRQKTNLELIHEAEGQFLSIKRRNK